MSTANVHYMYFFVYMLCELTAFKISLSIQTGGCLITDTPSNRNDEHETRDDVMTPLPNIHAGTTVTPVISVLIVPNDHTGPLLFQFHSMSFSHSCHPIAVVTFAFAIQYRSELPSLPSLWMYQLTAVQNKQVCMSLSQV